MGLNKRQKLSLYPKIVKRDGDRCVSCGQTAKDLAVEMLDIDRKSTQMIIGPDGKRRPDYSFKNCQLMCHKCNCRKDPKGKKRPMDVLDTESVAVQPMSEELRLSREYKPQFNREVYRLIKEYKRMEMKTLINAASNVAGCSQTTGRRYLDLLASFTGHYIIIKDAEKSYVRFRPGFMHHLDAAEELKQQVSNWKEAGEFPSKPDILMMGDLAGANNSIAG